MQMKASKISFGLLLAALTVTACAGVNADFVKPGATKEEIRADNATCRAEAEAQVGRDADISRDIRGTGRRGPADQRQLLEQTRDLGKAERYDRIFAACMAARGYKRQGR
jgi:hypothetical protein